MRKRMLFRRIIAYEDSIPNIRGIRPYTASMAQIESGDVGLEHTQCAICAILACRNHAPPRRIWTPSVR